MKQFILAILLAALPAVAATYHVSASTGNDANTAVQAQNPATPWATISHCSSVAIANDTCMVHAGTYSAWTQAASGTAGNPITFTVNPGDAVNINGTVRGDGTSYIVVGAPAAGGGCANNATLANNPMGGNMVGGCFQFGSNSGFGGGCSSPMTHWTVTYNSRTGGGGPSSCASGNAAFVLIPDGFATSTDNVFGHNKLNFTAAATPFCNNAYYVYGDRNRFEFDDVTGVGDDYLDGGGLNIVIRGNYLHDDNMNNSLGCGQSPEHADFFQDFGVLPSTQNSLVEGNMEQNCINDQGMCHALLLRGNSTHSNDKVIYRYNYSQNLNGSGISVGAGGTDLVTNTAIYNNTIATEALNAENGDFASCLASSTNGTIIANSVSYHTGSASWNPYGCQVSGNGVVLLGGNFSDAGTANCADGTHTCLTGTPGLANYPTDGTLTSGSQLRGAGIPIALTTASGTATTSVTVDHEYVFQPGWSGINGDCIRVGDATGSPTTCITAINNTTHVLTVSPAVTFNNGVGVYLWKKSDGGVVFNVGSNSRPDVGAFPFTAASLLSASPTSLNFGNQAVNTTSGPLTTTITNTTGSAVPITGISIIGANLGDFAQSNTCGSSIGASGTCTVTATFTPTGTANPRQANIQIAFTGTGSPLLVGLSGNGTTTAPITSYNPTSLNFGSVNINTTSAAKQIVLTNTGNAPLSISSIAASGVFAVSSTVPATNCGGTLAVNATCTINVTFSPVSVGGASGTLTVTSNAGSSPDGLGLSGTGFDPTAINILQNVACGPQSFVGPCTISATTAGSLLAVAFGGYNSCGTATTISSITDNASGGSSTYTQAAGARSTNTAGGATSFSDIWSAASVAAGITTVTITPSATCRGDAEIWEITNVNTVDTAGAVNSGAASATPSGAAVTTTAAKEAIIAMLHPVPGSAPTGTTGAFTSDSLNDGMAWAHLITSSTGTYTPQWAMTSGAFGASTVAFKQAAGGNPIVSLSVNSLAFNGLQVLQTNSPTLSVTLSNTGTANLAIASILPTTGNTADFIIKANTCGATLVENASCAVTVQFVPTAAGSRSTLLRFTTNAAEITDDVSLTGTAVLQPTSFGGVAVRGVR